MNSLSQFFSDFIASSTGESTAGQMFISILIAYLGGVLASLTPCVYPMIPITVSIVGGLGPTRKTWQEICARGVAYVGGMTVVYSFLGVLAGISGKVFGSMTNTSGWYLFLGIVMTFAALWMMEIIQFEPALFWAELKKIGTRRSQTTHSASHHAQQSHSQQTHHTAHSSQSTWMGAFFLGASSGFIAAPCTTPVLTSILAYIAKTQSVGLGFVLMASFSLGLGTLLIAITVFTGSLQLLPKSGQWMMRIKMGSGLILLAFAEVLIYRAGTSGGL